MSRLIEDAQLQEAQRTARVRSKIYGYAFERGNIVVVPEEAKVIEQIFTELNTITFMSCSRILEEIAKDFRLAQPQVRTRSNRLFTSALLLKIAVNPIYSGQEFDPTWQRYVPINNYPAMISPAQFRNSMKRLKREFLA